MSDEREPPRSRARLAFQIIGAILMGVLLIVFVIQPAVARGGWTELVIIVAIFVAILSLEWWARNR